MQGGRYQDIACAPQGAHQDPLRAITDYNRRTHQQGRHDNGQQLRIIGEILARGSGNIATITAMTAMKTVMVNNPAQPDRTIRR